MDSTGGKKNRNKEMQVDINSWLLFWILSNWGESNTNNGNILDAFKSWD